MTEERALIHSYGGGVQSAAVAVLVVQERLPRPERIVMADTGREASLTWRYLEESVQPFLGRAGLRVEVAPHSLAGFDTHLPSGDRRPAMPLFNDTGGRLNNACSREWKRRVVHRWLRREGYGPQRPVCEWLGISVDEFHRARTDSGLKWLSVQYPLLDLRLTRSDCIALVERAGLPTPPRSSCWMCPFRSDKEWLMLRERGDGDWEKAVEFDTSIREDGAAGKLYVHRTTKPLDHVSFRHEDQLTILGDECEEGRCEF